MITPVTHAHQFINQFIVGMVAHELRWTTHKIRASIWLWTLKWNTCRRIATALRKMRWLLRRGRRMCPSSFSFIHHISIPRREGRVGSRSRVSIVGLYSKTALELLRWRLLLLLLNCSTGPTVSVRHWFDTAS